VVRGNGRARRGLAAGTLASIARPRHVAQEPPVARCGEGVDELLPGVGCAAGIGAAVAVAGASADGPKFLSSPPIRTRTAARRADTSGGFACS
jgi:hypothetical protein